VYAQETRLLDYLVDTPFVLLTSIPGINVVSSASYAAELGPLEHYLGPAKISGRAGLYPSRSQSDRTDHAHGPLVAHRNARLRDAILRKLYRFGVDHDLAPEPLRDALLRVARQIPPAFRKAEAQALQPHLPREPKGPSRRARKAGPEPLSAILVDVMRYLVLGLPLRDERSEPNRPENP